MEEIRLTTEALAKASAEIKEAAKKGTERGYVYIDPEEYPSVSMLDLCEEEDK